MSGTRATPLRGIVFALVALSLFGGSLVACAARPPLTSPEADLPSPRAALTPQPTPGLQFRLSAGSAQEDNASVLPPAPAEPLPAAETEQLLERLPPLTGAAGDVMELNLPKQTLPAPRPGKTIKQSFPPAPVPATAPASCHRRARSAAVCARRRRAGCAQPQRHVQPANGGAHRAERPGEGRSSRQALAAARGAMALGGDQDARL